jgi:Flp pilus assembly protein TadB
MARSELAPGLYAVENDGTPQQLAAGAYSVDEEGTVGPAVDWQIPLSKLPWERAPELLEMWSKRSTGERIVNLVGMYLLVASIIAIAGFLAWQGIVEGQALVGFLGAALGYLLARGRIPGRTG